MKNGIDGQTQVPRDAMNMVILTPVRLLGEGLSACCDDQPDVRVLAVVTDLEGLRETLAKTDVELVLIDVTQGVELYDVRSIAAEQPDLALVALGLHEQRQEVIRCGRAGFVGYIARDASIDSLCNALADIVAGRQACPAEISGGLLRALFRRDGSNGEPDPANALTRRECEVLHLLGRGLSNKEIARELCLSIGTVKHHVHHVLEKLQLPTRAFAMRRVRDAPWLAATFPLRTHGESTVSFGETRARNRSGSTGISR
ncbi:response regulator transcription factor [Paraburkholderia terrae]|uniref:response regulator transcription factor n=1 Tax=Paraburkholderia terrae TaxID=311230 RepID=UPI00296B43C7|nr:response regulator transcription factor [Paraburkholderia terrae]MDW3660590.1 response regulator transcription factor [Paraburkholderia terrae]